MACVFCSEEECESVQCTRAHDQMIYVALHARAFCARALSAFQVQAVNRLVSIFSLIKYAHPHHSHSIAVIVVIFGAHGGQTFWLVDLVLR